MSLVPRPVATIRATARSQWMKIPPFVRGSILVSLGAIMLTFMAVIVKFLGKSISPLEIQFFRSIIGLALVMPLFWREPLAPFRSPKLNLHILRGALGAAANAFLFYSITHLPLADAMALQFSRPLWTIPLALFFLGELVGGTRLAAALVGFAGILVFARPFTDGFDVNALIGATGALFGALAIIDVKKLSETEETRAIVFHFAFWNTIFSFVPAIWVWVTPDLTQIFWLLAIGVCGIIGQLWITQGFKNGDASALVPLDYARIVYGAILGYFIFGEIPGVFSYIGMTLIIGASIYLVLTEQKRGK
jgi:drug/metabolite transporter (DMT)-like permease